jgi:hypothetical protein
MSKICFISLPYINEIPVNQNLVLKFWFFVQDSSIVPKIEGFVFFLRTIYGRGFSKKKKKNV